MADPIKVCMIAAEAVPFAKAGGLADVMGALPHALTEQGVDVILIMPRYAVVDADRFGLERRTDLGTIQIPMGTASKPMTVWSALSPDAVDADRLTVYFIENPEYFDREGIYNDPNTGQGYIDNAERFTFFMKGVLKALKALDWRPDVIHGNDYQTGLIPAYIKILWAQDPFFEDVATLYSIHNLAYQGIYPADVLDRMGFGREVFYPMSPFEFWGQVNFMKIGLVFADVLNTVSERYAEEIQSDPEFGVGLEEVLRDRTTDLYGILNGVDYAVWSPEVDKLIPYRYDIDHLEGKRKNKQELLKRQGLPWSSEDIPLIGMISRLADQKGFDLIAKIADELMGLNLQMVILGTGDRRYHEWLEKLATRYPTKIGVNLTFDNELAHLIEAGSDMFLMPSRYEPCGLNQLYSLRYGTVPIVRATGGLVDTIQNYDPATSEGNGLGFERYAPPDLLDAVERALKMYPMKETWVQIMRRGMTADFSWAVSARKYIDLYKKAWTKRRGEKIGPEPGRYSRGGSATRSLERTAP